MFKVLYVLLEWELMLVLHEWNQSLLRAILPVFVDSDVYPNLERLSSSPSFATKTKLVEI